MLFRSTCIHFLLCCFLWLYYLNKREREKERERENFNYIHVNAKKIKYIFSVYVNSFRSYLSILWSFFFFLSLALFHFVFVLLFFVNIRFLVLSRSFAFNFLHLCFLMLVLLLVCCCFFVSISTISTNANTLLLLLIQRRSSFHLPSRDTYSCYTHFNIKKRVTSLTTSPLQQTRATRGQTTTSTLISTLICYQCECFKSIR